MNIKDSTERQPMQHAGMASDDELQRQYYEAGKIFRLQIESTLSCPQLCDYCYAGSKPESPQGLSTLKIRELLSDAARLDVKVIDWLGGDPLMRLDWYELCQYANSLGLINNIWTSGIPLANPLVAEKAVAVSKDGFLSVHLDSINPALYMGVHGDGGQRAEIKNIDLIIQGVRNCIQKGKSPGAMVNCITLTKSLANGDAQCTIKYFYTQFGIKTCVTLYKPTNIAMNSPDWRPDLTRIKEVCNFRDTLYPGDQSFGAMDVSKFYCGSKICVNAFGWLVPCSVIRTEEFGNINNTPFDALIQLHRTRLLFLEFRDQSKMPGKCAECQNNAVCFGCRSNAFYYSKNLCAEDPMCQSFVSNFK